MNDPTAPDAPAPPAEPSPLELGMLHVADLQGMELSGLRRLAAALEVEALPGIRRRDLILRILERYVGRHGVTFAEGVLDVRPDGFGFLRSPDWSYLPSPEDVYLAAPLVASHGLRTGMVVGGQVRPPRENERYFTLVTVDHVAEFSPDSIPALADFEDLTPLHPCRPVRLECPGHPGNAALRVLDLVAPLGFGQRGLIVAPPRTGKTVLLEHVAQAMVQNHPDVALLLLLIDERPEEVTEMERCVDGEVIASTFDEPAARHIQVAEIVLEKAKRLVELGRDVVILLDSITRLGRAYNAEAPASGRILTGGVDAGALQKPKRFFGAARNVEEGGSLTVLATALVDTGSRMDEVIFEEFKGTGNLEWVLCRQLAERRVWPALDIPRSGTRMEERILSPERLRLSWILRKVLGGMNPVEAMELLLERVRSTATNQELLEATLRGS